MTNYNNNIWYAIVDDDDPEEYDFGTRSYHTAIIWLHNIKQVNPYNNPRIVRCWDDGINPLRRVSLMDFCERVG